MGIMVDRIAYFSSEMLLFFSFDSLTFQYYICFTDQP